MKEKNKNQPEDFTGRILQSAALESPSRDFTAKVMFRATQKRHAFAYKPLIPKPVFAAVLVFFVSAFIFLPEHNEPQTISWLSYDGIGQVFDLAGSVFFEFSEMASYTAAFATLLFFVQIFVLKKYFDKQFKNYNIPL